jgi:hypothetical protein
MKSMATGEGDKTAEGGGAPEGDVKVSLTGQQDAPKVDKDGKPIVEGTPKDGDKPKDEGNKDGKDGKDPKAGDKTDKKSDGAPEKYADFTLPEGYEKDEELLGEFSALAKEANLPQEVAQKFVDLQAKFLTKTAGDNDKAWNDLHQSWIKSAKEDKDIGGATYEKNVGLANQALAKYGTPELFKMLLDTRTGDHPELIRVFSKIGAAMGTEDKGGGGPPLSDKKGKSAAETIFSDHQNPG